MLSSGLATILHEWPKTDTEIQYQYIPCRLPFDISAATNGIDIKVKLNKN
jgi:hypothetical protein